MNLELFLLRTFFVVFIFVHRQKVKSIKFFRESCLVLMKSIHVYCQLCVVYQVAIIGLLGKLCRQREEEEEKRGSEEKS